MMKIENWGIVPYAEAWNRQEQLFNELIEAKKDGQPYVNRIILYSILTFIHWEKVGKKPICF